MSYFCSPDWTVWLILRLTGYNSCCQHAFQHLFITSSGTNLRFQSSMSASFIKFYITFSWLNEVTSWPHVLNLYVIWCASGCVCDACNFQSINAYIQDLNDFIYRVSYYPYFESADSSGNLQLQKAISQKKHSSNKWIPLTPCMSRSVLQLSLQMTVIKLRVNG